VPRSLEEIYRGILGLQSPVFQEALELFGQQIAERHVAELLFTLPGVANPVRRGYDLLRRRLSELAAARPRHGHPRLHLLLRREGWTISKKVVYRIYPEEGLTMRRKRPGRRLRGFQWTP
jgi:hypothetical protein